MDAMIAAETKLYYREGTSDKFYDVQLVLLSVGPPVVWSVTFAYGRRGKLPLRGIKLERGGYFAAKEAYEKLVSAKMNGHGYKLAFGPVRLPPTTFVWADELAKIEAEERGTEARKTDRVVMKLKRKDTEPAPVTARPIRRILLDEEN